MECQERESACPSGQVEFVTERPGGQDSAGDSTSTACLEAPPACPSPSHLGRTATAWSCLNCEVVIQYGDLYGGKRVCVDRPRMACPSGQVPTLVFESASWECRATCDNGEYDQLQLGDRLVCVPC